jgi:hypothetical protein
MKDIDRLNFENALRKHFVSKGVIRQFKNNVTMARPDGTRLERRAYEAMVRRGSIKREVKLWTI